MNLRGVKQRGQAKVDIGIKGKLYENDEARKNKKSKEFSLKSFYLIDIRRITKILCAWERRNDLPWRGVITVASTCKYRITQLITSSADQSIVILDWGRKQWKDNWQSAKKELVELRNDSSCTLWRNESRKSTATESVARGKFISLISWILNPRIQKG